MAVAFLRARLVGEARPATFSSRAHVSRGLSLIFTIHLPPETKRDFKAGGVPGARNAFRGFLREININEGGNRGYLRADGCCAGTFVNSIEIAESALATLA